MKTELVITKTEGETIRLSGLSLLQILNKVTYNVLTNVPNCSSERLEKLMILKISSPTDWLNVAYKLYLNASSYRKSFQYNQINVQLEESPYQIEIHGAFNRIVKFPNPGSGSYIGITEKIKDILSKENITDKDLAESFIKRLLLHSYPENLSKYARLLDSLLVLICCVEPSRHFPTAAYSIMLLDLIKFGNGKTTYSWLNVFISGKNYHWEDYEAKNFGGKFPLAVSSTGSNNLKEIVALFTSSKNFKEDLLREETKKLCYQSQHHAIALRGITMLINWINSLGKKSTYQYLQSSKNQTELANRIEELLTKRFIIKYKITANAITSKVTENIPSIKFSEPRYIELSGFIKNFPIESFSSYEEYFRAIESNQCIIFTHDNLTTTSNSKKSHYFHRANRACKLIPEYILEGKEKEIHDSSTYTVKAKTRLSTIKKAIESGLKPCPCCYSPGQRHVLNPLLVSTYTSIPNQLHLFNGKCDKSLKENASEKRKLSFFAKYRDSKNSQFCKSCWPHKDIDTVKELTLNVPKLKI